MRAALKRLAREALAAPPAARLLGAWAGRGDPVALLCYHTLGPDDGMTDAWTMLRERDFRDQLSAIAERYEIVALDAVVAEGPGRRRCGRPRAVLTFDDGDRGLHRHLLPIVEAERVPVTIYVATGQIETGTPYWFDRVMNALAAPGAFTIDLRSRGLGAWSLSAERGETRWFAVADILEVLKRVAPAAREELAEEVVSQAPPARGIAQLMPMTRTELVEMARHPLVTIGAHSHCHSLLDQIPLHAAEASMALSRSLLEEWTGRAVRHFAWPNGNRSPALLRIAERLGFVTAASLGGQLWRRDANLLDLPRLPIGRHDDLARFRLRLLGLSGRPAAS